MGDGQIEEFRRAAIGLAGADRTVMSAVGKQMRRVAKPVVGEIRDTVRSSKGRSERGQSASSVERQLHVLARSGRGSMMPLSERQIRAKLKKLASVSSLRSNIANATGSAVSSAPDKVSLSFKVRASQLPPKQRKLPRRWDAEGGWKHPVFGNRKIWVKQVGNPYFRKTIFRRKDDVTSAVIDAMDEAAEKITHPEGGAL